MTIENIFIIYLLIKQSILLNNSNADIIDYLINLNYR